MSSITFTCPDGALGSAYVVEPAAPDRNAGVVIGHELWGITAPMREVAQRCASLGYRALVVDLFRGQLARDLQHGFQLMGSLDWQRAAEQDLRGAAQWLRARGAAAVVMGFCMGGALSILAAERVPELSAAVCFYGVPPPEISNPERIRCPLLGHFAERDDWCTPSKVAALEQRLREGRVPYELHRYDVHHAFMNPEGEGYSASAAQLAWSRTVEFLERAPAPTRGG